LRDGRYSLSKGLNFLLNFGFRMDLRDNKSGFFVCRREVLEDILRHRFSYYHFQTFIMVAAHARGYKIREVEVLFDSRKVGESFIPRFPFRLVTQALLDFPAALWEYRFSDKPQTVVAEYLRE